MDKYLSAHLIYYLKKVNLSLPLAWCVFSTSGNTFISCIGFAILFRLQIASSRKLNYSIRFV